MENGAFALHSNQIPPGSFFYAHLFVVPICYPVASCSFEDFMLDMIEILPVGTNN